MYINQQSGVITEDSTGIKPDSASAAVSLEDSILSASNPKDTTASAILPEPNASTTGFYKFIIETTNDKSRALKRYYSLRSYGNKVSLQTKDSIHYKIYYNLPATPADTLRIRDSLNRFYYKGNGPVRVRVEQ